MSQPPLCPATARQPMTERLRRQRPVQRDGGRGFTLIEAMIVVAIMAILTAIALPIYQGYVARSRRTAAKTTVLDVARREEAYYSTNNVYTTLDNLGYANLVGGAIQAPGNGEDFYNVTITLPNPNSQVSGANASFLITATPQGVQANDTCGSYTLTDLGVQANTGNTETNCW
ncbi:type IV pilin protein [Dyella sp. C9]|uniref:type IV pilin protein n=1 Tax=Dyella sp. C9 TaxID=2202154 RepID=UPI00271455CE|nr:type IV pilin protein [Dyella sp. C9]